MALSETLPGTPSRKISADTGSADTLQTRFRERLTRVEGRTIVPPEFADVISRTDHSTLGAVDEEAITRTCKEAASIAPYPNSVCVQGARWTRHAVDTLRNLGCEREIPVAAVGDRQFPRQPLAPLDAEGKLANPNELPGIIPLNDKLQDVTEALAAGATIFDMVLNSQFVLEGKTDEAVEEIRAVRQLMDRTNPSAPLRVICSTGLLRQLGGEEMVKRACQIVTRAAEGAKKGIFVMKTETGFVLKPDGKSKFGATVEDIKLMRSELPPHVRIKASGGASKKNAREIRAAGADYIGASGVVREFLS